MEVENRVPRPEAPPGPPCPLCGHPVRAPRLRSVWYKLRRQTEGEPELVPAHESCCRREMFTKLGLVESDIRDAPRGPPRPMTPAERAARLNSGGLR